MSLEAVRNRFTNCVRVSWWCCFNILQDFLFHLMQCDIFFFNISLVIFFPSQTIWCCCLPSYHVWHHLGVMHINYSNIWLKNASKVNWIYIVIYDRKIYFSREKKKKVSEFFISPTGRLNDEMGEFCCKMESIV